MSNDVVQRREVTMYGVAIYSITDHTHVERILSALQTRYRPWPTPLSYEPEGGKVELKFSQEQQFELGYALAMIFMQGIIPGYAVVRFYLSGPHSVIQCYSRERNGRRYRLTRGKKWYIDPEPKLAEAVEAA